MRQNNFTVGVRGRSQHMLNRRLSLAPKAEILCPKELAELGITQKAAVKRMQNGGHQNSGCARSNDRSYYAVKFNVLSNLSFEKSFKDPHLVQRIIKHS